MSENNPLSKARKFWQALRKDKDTPKHQSKPIELANDLSHLDEDELEYRKQALKCMLESNVARQQGARRHRRPTMEPGQRVAIIDGELVSDDGIVIDADFIHGRVLLAIDGMSEPVWLPFGYVAAIEY